MYNSRSWNQFVINWFPGHMNKAQKSIQEKLEKVQNIIEIRDARIPMSSGNPLLSSMIRESKKNFRHLLVFNKDDLADPKISHKWKEYYLNYDKDDFSGHLVEKDGEVEIIPFFTSLTSSKDSSGQWNYKQRKEFLSLLNSLKTSSRKMPKSSDKASVGPVTNESNQIQQSNLNDTDLRIAPSIIRSSSSISYKPNISMIIGLPNVGKSTMINQLSGGKKSAGVAAKPAWTRGLQLIRIDHHNQSGSSNSSASRRNTRIGRIGNTSNFDADSILASSPVNIHSNQFKNNVDAAVRNGGSSGASETAAKMNLFASASSTSLSSMSQPLWLIDSPGIMIPSRIDTEVGLKLALCGCVTENAIPSSFITMADFLHYKLHSLSFVPKPQKWLPGLGIQADFDASSFDNLLEEIGRVKGKRERMEQASTLVQAFRKGALGRISLESPEEQQQQQTI